MSKILYKISILLFLFISLLAITGCKKKIKFNVNFYIDNQIYEVVGTNGKEVIEMPVNPTKEGYTFEGWYWDEGTWLKPFTAQSLVQTPLIEDMNVYAYFLDEDAPRGTDLKFKDGVLVEHDGIGDTYLVIVSNSTIAFSFSDYVEISNKSTWTVSTDMSGNNTIASKTVELEVGNNLYFVQVFDSETNKVKQYNIAVRRRPIYTVYFDTNGGTSCSMQRVEEDSLVTEPTTLKTGYTFAGWDYNFNTPLKSDIVISASWSPNQYTITFDANGGSLSSNQLKVTYDKSYTLPIPIRLGYTFNGWYENNNKVINGTWYRTSNVSLVAKWTANTYNISYDLKGGNLYTNKPSTYKTDSVVEIGNPSKTGYEFIGWSVNGSSKKYKDYVINNTYGDISLVANFEANTYSVTLDSNGGECKDDLLTVTYNKSYVLPIPTKMGYKFEGWYNGSAKVESGIWTRTSNLDLKAKWSIANYTITYNLNDGVNNQNNPNSYTIETDTIKLLDASKKGYTFIGWTSDEITVPSKNVVIEKGTTGNVKYTANFTANKYNVTLDVNGGNNLEKNDLEVIYCNSYTLPKPEKNGYEFKGWYNEDNELINDGLWKTDLDVELVAKWEIITYKINYVLNGGVNSNQNLQSYNYEYSDISIYNPTKTGYIFNGWMVNGEHELVSEYVINHNSLGDITLEAVFTANTYNLTLDVNSGNSLEKDEFKINYDEKFSLEVPTRTGYTFDGWYNGSSKVENGTWKYLEDVTLKAKWNIINYTITYNLDDGVNNSNNVSKYTYESDDIIISEPTKVGYTFLGWSYDDVIVPVKEVVISHNSTGDIELNANFQVNTYYITYDVNGGNELDQNVVGIVYDTNFSLIIPTKDGYEFDGWYIDSTKFVSGRWTKTDDITLTAKWSLINYSISYILDGGKNNAYNPTKYNYEYQDIVINNPTKTGYTFIGWSINDSEELLIDYIIKQYSYGNLVLKANWQVNVYKLTLDINGGDELNKNEFNIEYGADYSLPEPSRTGYTFDGWYNGTTKVENGTWKYLEDITLTAKWNIIYFNINYELNGATMNENPSTYTYDDETIVLNEPYKTGYTFVGWITDSIFIPTEELEIPHNSLGEFSFEAIFEVNTYLITFDVNGGNQLDINEMEVVYGEYVELPIPTNDSYIFVGWYFGDTKVMNSEWNIEGNITLKSYWIKYYVENEIKILSLGKYPQSVVTDLGIISDLNKITVTNSLGYIELYGQEYLYSNGNYYIVEELKWIVLSETTDGTYKLLSLNIIDRQKFYNNGSSVGGYGSGAYYNIRKIGGTNVYSNNYQFSNIRAWLNGYDGTEYLVENYNNKGFVDYAFSEIEYKIINDTILDDSSMDKVYLLNSSEWYNYKSIINQSNAFYTDFYLSKSSDGFYNDQWMLRSGSSRSSGADYGRYYENHYIYSLDVESGSVRNQYGVRPVITINI